MDTTVVVVVAACGMAGLVVGSFLTLVAVRVPRHESVLRPVSTCRACDHELAAPDLVPVVSWLLLRGRCRHCGARIGAEPLLIEVATATVFALFGLRFGADVALIAFCVLGAALVALTAIDLRELRLPREITYTAAAISGPILAVAAFVGDQPERIRQAALGAGLALAIMGGIALLSRGGVGEGDVRLAPLLGMHLGYLDPALVPVGLFIGFLSGAAVAVVALATGSAGRATALPFGPFLAVGTVSAVLFGDELVDVVSWG